MNAAPSRRNERQRRGRHLKALRRTCEDILGALEVADSPDMFALCEQVGRRRERPVRLAAVDLRDTGVYGLWIATQDEDFVLYESHTSRLHQEHIVAHELAHILCDHHRGGDLDDQSIHLLFPNLEPSVVRGMLGRCGYLAAEEQEAEVMASVLLTRVQRKPAEATWDVSAEAAQTIARIESVVGQETHQERP
ncbi:MULTISPECIES: ImmA/IrrE family metallo-endopeptidase [unclassified Streptomyces]|uniref:ImmA/IrrE family metallo-endopeptidase n=1 Tax=unclassified Streptomyces TaxID=2593676 RepID=UPI0022B6E1D4|nr:MULTISPECIES: ImmA/IrrE family metallo-endopeptidase [unclassified Streptomyces]MCZ7415731.1 ImmA/IrrE family metallo-endopeptidase [Streptomyces sp. WMMC897]MCZ7434458.1 ImmA/IrrE family metallo-endopeptidase [Streptomyces sp. WMMC1477]